MNHTCFFFVVIRSFMHIPPEAQKVQLLNDLERARNDLLSAATSLPAEKRSEPFLGVWNVQDLIAHLLDRDFTNIQAMQASAFGFNDQGEVNAAPISTALASSIMDRL